WMKDMKKLRLFFQQDKSVRGMFLEAYILLAWARLLKQIPFAKVAPKLGKQMTETSYVIDSTARKITLNISHAIHIMSRYTFWESECLVKALAAKRMLEKRQIESTLYLGTAKEESGSFIAHAWLRSGPYYVTGAEGMERVTIVQSFASNRSE